MIEVRRVFHLSCPDREQLVSRMRKRALKENRFDDANEETIRRRLNIYDEESKPVIEHYPASVRTDVDGTVFVEPGQKTDTYTVAVTVPAGESVTAFRIESLPHDSLPGKGAGGANGNFVVTRVRAGIKPLEPLRRARYVRVESPGKSRMLSLAEVEVFSSGKNVAAGGVATQSSTGEGAEAKRAIDGRTDGDILNGSVSQTATSDDPWLELDLGSSLPLERVLIWGRRGEEGTPAGLRVTVLDDKRQPVFERVTREMPRPTNTIPIFSIVE